MAGGDAEELRNLLGDDPNLMAQVLQTHSSMLEQSPETAATFMKDDHDNRDDSLERQSLDASPDQPMMIMANQYQSQHVSHDHSIESPEARGSRFNPHYRTNLSEHSPSIMKMNPTSPKQFPSANYTQDQVVRFV